jgi:hypothetical protein
VPDIIDDDPVTPMQYLVDHAVVPDTDPVQVFCTGKLVSIVRHWLRGQAPDVLKNVGNYFFGNFPDILFSALLERDRIRIHREGSHHAFLQFGKTDRAFIPPFGNHGKIVKVFTEVFIFPDGENNRDLVAVFIYDILFRC